VGEARFDPTAPAQTMEPYSAISQFALLKPASVNVIIWRECRSLLIFFKVCRIMFSPTDDPITNSSYLFPTCVLIAFLDLRIGAVSDSERAFVIWLVIESCSLLLAALID
jgi:hypothetical protein